jgi:hypothetical protein
MTLQYFVNYNLKKGWYLSSSPLISANWKASTGNVLWTVRVGGGVGRILRLGLQPVNISVQFYGNAAQPSGRLSVGYAATDCLSVSQIASRAEREAERFAAEVRLVSLAY